MSWGLKIEISQARSQSRSKWSIERPNDIVFLVWQVRLIIIRDLTPYVLDIIVEATWYILISKSNDRENHGKQEQKNAVENEEDLKVKNDLLDHGYNITELSEDSKEEESLVDLLS